jgi:hypothetical protein
MVYGIGKPPEVEGGGMRRLRVKMGAMGAIS